MSYNVAMIKKGRFRFFRCLLSKLPWCWLAMAPAFAYAQVDHFEIAPISSPQHVSGLFSSLPFPIMVTARALDGSVAPFNGEVALSQILNGVPDYTYTFEEGNLNGWTRLNTDSSYAVTALDVDGDGRDSSALDMRLNNGRGYGTSRQVYLQGGVPYSLSISTALKSDQDVFYGGPYVRWSLQVGSSTVTDYQLGLGYLFSNLTFRTGLSGTYVPPTNGLYSIAFVFECPMSESHVHVYADDFRVSYSGLSCSSLLLANGQGLIYATASLPATNMILRASDAQAHFGDSNPFDLLPTASLNVSTTWSAPLRVGEDIVYHINVNNFGPSTATDVKLTNVPPAGFTILSALPSQGTCTNIGGILYCNFGNIPSDATYQDLTITARTTTPGSYTNVASLGANEYQPYSFWRFTEQIAVLPVEQPFVEAPPVAASESSGAIRFKLNLRGPSTEALIVNYCSSNLTALAGIDYSPVTGQLIFFPGETNKEVQVTLFDNALSEKDKTFALTFSAPTQDGVAIATILDDDPLPAISIADASGLEGGFGTNEFLLELNLSQPSGRDVSVHFVTSDGTATAGRDYLPLGGVVIFPAGATTATLALSILGNTVNEPDEAFFVNLSQPTNATLARPAATVTILNDDAVPDQFEHFEWNTVLSPQVAGRSIGLKAAARDAFNNPVTSFNGTVPLTILQRGSNATNFIPPILAMSFTNGLGLLELVLTNAYTNVVCRLDDGMDHVAESVPFNALALLPMSLKIPSNATEGDGVLIAQGKVWLTYADDRDVTVTLQSADTTEIQVPPSLLIPAGETSAVFDVVAIDDSLFDGSRPVTVTATATNHTSATDVMTVLDNEPGVLSVTLPTSVQEKGPSTQGRVEMNVPASEPVQILLTSSDTTELIVPATVTIAAGQTFALFNLQIIDDSLVDGPQSVSVSAHVQNWIDGVASTIVQDNESTNLVVGYVFQGPFDEGRGTITNGFAVRLGGTAVSNVVVHLVSSDTTELLVPESIIIAAGQNYTNFPITIVDDTETDGPQPVTVTASAEGFASGSLSLTVRDNDAHHFEFGPPLSGGSRTSTVPFSISLVAKDVAGNTLTAFSGPVHLSAVGDLGYVALVPKNTTTFERGSWGGFVTITNGAHTNVRLIADDGFGHTGQSASFNVYAPLAQQTRILEATIRGNDIQLLFSTVEGRHYRVEAVSDLSSTAWTTVLPDLVGSGVPMLVTCPRGLQMSPQFYRVALQP